MIVHSTYYLCINMLYVSFTRPLPSLATVPPHRAELGTGTSRSLDAGAVDADHRESPTVCALEVAGKTHPVDISLMKFGHIKICKIFGEYGVGGPVCSLASLNLGFTSVLPMTSPGTSQMQRRNTNHWRCSQFNRCVFILACGFTDL